MDDIGGDPQQLDHPTSALQNSGNHARINGRRAAQGLKGVCIVETFSESHRPITVLTLGDRLTGKNVKTIMPIVLLNDPHKVVQVRGAPLKHLQEMAASEKQQASDIAAPVLYLGTSQDDANVDAAKLWLG